MNIYYVTFLFVSFQIIQIIWCFVRFKKTEKQYKCSKYKKIRNEKCEWKSTINIVIPCLREQDIICDTINYFVSILPNKEKYRIIIATTQKENEEKRKGERLLPALEAKIKANESIDTLLQKYNVIFSRHQLEDLVKETIGCNDDEIHSHVYEAYNTKHTTYDVVHEFIMEKKLDEIVELIDYPFPNGMMAHQLNYVLTQLNKRNNTYKHSYFCLYNADSRPSPKTFFEAEKIINANQGPQVIQQYSTLTSNIRNISPVLKGFAIYQTNFELRNGLINALFHSKYLRNHVVGHGLFIQEDFLNRIGGFSTDFWCEDIYLSFVLRSKKIYPVPLLSLEKAETANSLPNLIRQNGVWFKSAFQAVKMFVNVLKKNKSCNAETLLFLFHQLRGSISWLLSPILVILFLCIPLVSRQYILFLFAFFMFVINKAAMYYETCLLVEESQSDCFHSKSILCIEGIMAYFISNLGPLYSIMFNNKKEKYKTVR